MWKFVYILLRICVLIDTWWNVNTNKLGAGVEEVTVLIDTWWNVNTNKLGAGVEEVTF